MVLFKTALFCFTPLINTGYNDYCVYVRVYDTVCSTPCGKYRAGRECTMWCQCFDCENQPETTEEGVSVEEEKEEQEEEQDDEEDGGSSSDESDDSDEDDDEMEV